MTTLPQQSLAAVATAPNVIEMRQLDIPEIGDDRTIFWHNCISGGAYLYAKTQKGVAPHMIKDLVRLNPASVKLWNGQRWTQVMSWEQAVKTEPGIEITLRSGERIGSTADHYWPTQRGSVPTGKLRVGDILQACRLPNEGGRPAWLNIDALWFMGLYLAEGSRSGNTLQISGHVKEQERWQRIRQLCSHYGSTCRFYQEGNGVNAHIDQSAALRAILETAIGGNTAHDKHFRNVVWSWGDQSIREIVGGYLEGDGHNDVRNQRVRLGFTRNYALERDLRTAAARLGALITLRLATARNGDKVFPAFRGEWRWQHPLHSNVKPRAEIVATGKSKARKFWDIELVDTSHAVALSSGLLTQISNPIRETAFDFRTRYQRR